MVPEVVVRCDICKCAAIILIDINSHTVSLAE